MEKFDTPEIDEPDRERMEKQQMTRYLVVSAFVTITAFACSTNEPANESVNAENVSFLQSEPLDPQVAAQEVGISAISKILIFGDYDAAKSTLSGSLRLGGHNVDVKAALPTTIDELRPYNTIWHVGINRQLQEYERELLVEFVNAGGGLHLSGERTQSDAMNDSLELVVNELVVGGPISVGRLGDTPPARGLFFNGYYNINPTVLGNISTTPNMLADIQMAGVGRLGGITDTRNILATGAYDLPVGAIWASEDLTAGAGVLSILMDSSWLTLPHEGNPLFLQNLQEFLNGNPNEPPVADAGQDQRINCAPADGTTTVRLDGSASSDPDEADVLTYTWSQGGTVLGSGAVATLQLGPGIHTMTLTVSDGRLESSDTVVVEVLECPANCSPNRSFWEYCTPECPCFHGEGDCDEDIDCQPGLTCLHDPGPDFGYLDPEADVCSNNCPTLGVGAWNYCSEECPCTAGEGDCESDAECETGLRCVSDVGAAYGWDNETDVCEPASGV